MSDIKIDKVRFFTKKYIPRKESVEHQNIYKNTKMTNQIILIIFSIFSISPILWITKIIIKFLFI